MKNNLLFLLPAILLLFPQGACGQQPLSASHSNYAGLADVFWNPATVAGNLYKFQLFAASVNTHASKAAYDYEGPFGLRPPTISDAITPHTQIFSSGADIHGPSLLIQLNSSNTIAVNSRSRFLFQGSDLSPELLQSALNGFKEAKHWGNSSVNLNYNTLTDWSFTYGHVFAVKNRHSWKVGLTAKLVAGMGSAYLHGNNINYEVYPAPNNEVLLIHQFQGSYGYAQLEREPKISLVTASQWLLGHNARGYGEGADVGVVYEYRPRSDEQWIGKSTFLKKNYLLRISAAVTDIGVVSYRTNAVAYDNLSLSDVGLGKDALTGINLNTYPDKLNNIFNPPTLSQKTSFVANLPTSLNIDVDYHFTRVLYINASLCQGLSTRLSTGMRNFSYAALAPRIETRQFEVALPVSFAYDYNYLNIGATLRVGPLVVGMNNLLMQKPYGTNAYAELSLLKLLNKKSKVN
jgi:hypothetical protein